MQIIIQSPHTLIEEGLNDFIKFKVGKLARIYQMIESASVTIKAEKQEAEERCICEIKLTIGGNDLYARKDSKTFEEATDKTIAALKEPLEKMKLKFERQ